MNHQSPIPIQDAPDESAQIAVLSAHLQQQHGIPAADIQVVRAPLRISPLGAHIDHQLGHTTGMTINRSLLLVFAPTRDGSVTVESLNFQPPVSFQLNRVPPATPSDWGNYLRGAVLALQQDYPLKTGFVGIIEGQMPVGGLSSSAAGTLAYLLALETVNGLGISPMENVSLVRYAENQYIGVNNGILDQTTILFGEPNQLLYIDCKSTTVEAIATPIRPADYDIFIVFSGISRVLTGTGYNNRVAECMAAARQLLGYAGQPTPAEVRLGEVEATIFEAESHRLPVKLRQRAGHFFGEYHRVSEGVQAWQRGDLAEFGSLMNASGESSITLYESGSPQLITLYHILSQLPGVFGSRFSGGGFGGSCIALIDPAARDSVAAAIRQHYPVAHPQEAAHCSMHICRSAGPVGLVAEQ